jgi:RimJ/RimL family protein N-acetyltransferase
MDKLNAREMTIEDIPLICKYWTESDPAHMEAMGVDLKKLPTREQLTDMLTSQINTPIEKRRSYCMIWEVDGEPVGHCNTNPTHFGDYGFMHLHLWNGTNRQKGMGAELVKMTLPRFFEDLNLRELYCEPYALNPAPNATLAKAGFEFIKEYTTTPGPLNFEQPVKRWIMTRRQYKTVYGL